MEYIVPILWQTSFVAEYRHSITVCPTILGSTVLLFKNQSDTYNVYFPRHQGNFYCSECHRLLTGILLIYSVFFGRYNHQAKI